MTAPSEREAIVTIVRSVRLAASSESIADRIIAEHIAPIRTALAKAEAERDEAHHFIRRIEEARGKLPDWEKLWEEQSNQADAAEALLVECETELQRATSPRSPRYDTEAIRALLAKLKARKE